jgi:cysteinyl-tRNA synthetase
VVARAAQGHTSAAALAAPVCDARDAFWAALDDDFHFERALGALDRALEAAAATHGGQAAAARKALREMGDALGLLWGLA